MSCGNHHETDCATVLDRLYEYIDQEMGDDDYTVVRRHLDECIPCLRKHDLEREVKWLVQRACGCEPVPDDLRAKVLLRIRQVRVDLPSSDTRVDVERARGPEGDVVR